MPTPYHSALFARLAERPGIDLRVFYCAGGHDDVGWQLDGGATMAHPHEILRNWTPRRWRRRTMIGSVNVPVWRRLRGFGPDAVVVFGYNQLTYWLTYFYCRSRRIPFALRSDSNGYLDISQTLVSRLRRRQLRWLTPRADAILAVGTANADYWRRYGASERQLQLAPFAVDNAAVARLAAPRTRSTGPLRFLYIGRLIHRKRVDLLLECFNRLCAVPLAASLTIVGDGPERQRLAELVSSSARPRVEWAGKTTHRDAMRRLADADVLVLPAANEPWGLVVNEALAAGVAVIADGTAGAAVDLIENGVTGWKLGPLDAESLFGAMRQCIAEPERVQRMGANAQRRMQSWSLERCVEVFHRWLDERHRQLPPPMHPDQRSGMIR